MTQLLDDAVDALERRVFFERLTSRYDELRNDPEMWSALEAERATESGSVGDRSR